MIKHALAAAVLLVAAASVSLAEPVEGLTPQEHAAQGLQIKIGDGVFQQLNIKSIEHNKVTGAFVVTTTGGEEIKFTLPDGFKELYARKGINVPNVPDLRPLPAATAAAED